MLCTVSDYQGYRVIAVSVSTWARAVVGTLTLSPRISICGTLNFCRPAEKSGQSPLCPLLDLGICSNMRWLKVDAILIANHSTYHTPGLPDLPQDAKKSPVG